MNRKRFSVDQVAQALRDADGILVDAAEALGCHRNTLSNYIREHRELEDLREECRRTIVDKAEKALLVKLDEGDVRCAMFILRTLGRHRGYSTQSGYRDEELKREKSFQESVLGIPDPLEEFEIPRKKRVKKSGKAGDRRLQSVS